jgi:hypothetical protein
MAEVKTIKINVDTKDGVQNIENLNSALEDTGKTANETDNSMKELTSGADKATGGLISKFTAFKGAIGVVSKAFVGLRGAIMATGLGALVIVVASLINAFKNSEEGQNKFAKLMAQIGTITGNVMDLLATFGEKIIWVFENPKKALTQFGEMIKQNITNRVMGMLELFPALGKAIKLVFEGEFKEAAKIAADAVGKVTTGIDKITDKTKGAIKAGQDFIEHNKKELKQTREVADMRAKADIIERNLLVQRAKLEGDIAELKLKSRDVENYTAEERLAALKKAQTLEDSLLKKEEESLRLRFEAQQMENTFSRTDKENADKEAQAQANLLKIRATRLDQQRSTLREINRTNREIQGQEKAANQEAIKLQEEKLKAEEEAAKESGKIEEERLKKIADANREANRLAVEKQQELDNRLEQISEQNYLNALSEKQREIQLVNDKYFELETLAQGNADALAEIAIAKNAELKVIQDKKDKEEIEAAKAVEAQKVAIQMQGLETAMQGVQLIKGLFEQQKGVQKAAVIAESAIGIAKMIIANKQANIAALATPQAIATSGAAAAPVIALNNITTGIGIAANIAATAKALKTLGGGSTPTPPAVGGGGSVGGSQAPNFNVVGNSGFNQLAQIQQTPMQAYVVSGEVTSAQALDRNRIKNATL